MKPIAILFSLLISSATFLLAQDSDDKNKWTPEDIINTEYVRSVQIAPNNNMVVWTKRKGLKKEDKFVSDIYLTRLDLKKDDQFRNLAMTNGKDNDFAPFFSKNSETIYFRSSRDKGKKLWSLSIFGGEAKEVHEFKNGISNTQWLNDSTMTFVSNEGKTLYEQELEKKKDNVVVVEDEEHWKISHIYSFSTKDKTIKRLSENTYPVGSYTASRDGNWIIYSTIQSRHYASDANPDPKYYLHDMSDGSRTEILKGFQSPGDFQFSEDGKGFYFRAVRSSNPEWNGAGISELYYFTLSFNTFKKVDLDWNWAMGGGYDVVENDVMVGLANGPTNKLAFYQKNGTGWSKSDIDLGNKSQHVSILDVSDDFSKVIYEHSTAGQLPKYYIADISIAGGQLSFTNEKELTKANKKLRSKPITKHEVLFWKGWNKEEVSGLLFYPEDYEAGKRYPLIISIHGGPAGVDQDRWRERWSTYPQIFAQKGAFVLKPNYHGSSNHGQAFVESIKGNYYDPELEDIRQGVELLNMRGLIDKDQMGVMGWSNGAILATMLTVRHPDMFKVCAAGAGDVNWTSDYGTCRFGVSFDQSYFGGAPWDDVNGKTYNERYVTLSPLFELEKVKTPTIIFHGSEDRAVPRDQGWEYYRALQQVEKAAVKFLWFPGQPHGLQKITHQTRKMKEEIAWIDQHLFNNYKAPNEAFKKDSPLAMLLKIDKRTTENSHFGKMESGILVPEVAEVKKDSIAIGVFEITNAQYKYFRPAYTYMTGTDNHPAVVAYNDAKAYTEWLSTKTGTTYRLPNKAEAKTLHKKARKAGAKENSLNYWAGYDLTIADLEDFQKKVTEAKQSLLKEVGSFKSTKVGEAELYDLGGNVSEYRNDGKKYGFSAYDYVDPNGDSTKAGTTSHTGFRVVKE